jgi:hypothetical protein
MSLRKIPAVLALPLLLALTACAVQHSKAPQIDAATTARLNLASQVDQANRDYKTFFSDVGDAQRAGRLSAPNVATLNQGGTQLKAFIEKANALEKIYAKNYDAGIATQISALLLEAAQLYAGMYTQRAQMLVQGGASK